MSEPDKLRENREKSPFDMGAAFGPAQYEPIKREDYTPPQNSPFRRSLMTDELAQLESQLHSVELSSIDKHRLDERIESLRQAIGLEPEASVPTNLNPNSPQETLAEAENRLIGEISALTHKLAGTNDPGERRRIDDAIRGKQIGLDTLRGEKSGRLDQNPPANKEASSKVTEISPKPVLLNLETRYPLEPAIVSLIKETLNLVTEPEFGGRAAQISTDGFLLSAIYQGMLDPDSHPDVAFLAAHFANRASITQGSLRSVLAGALFRESKPRSKGRLPQFSSELEDAFAHGKELALITTGQSTILMRHLIGTICLRLPGRNGHAEADALRDAHLDINALGPAFLEFILRTYQNDNRQIWNTEFGKVFRVKADSGRSSEREARDPYGPRPTKDDLRLAQGIEEKRRLEALRQESKPAEAFGSKDSGGETGTLEAAFLEQYYALREGRSWLPDGLNWSDSILASFDFLFARAHLEVKNGRRIQFTPLLVLVAIFHNRKDGSADDFSAAMRRGAKLNQQRFDRLRDYAFEHADDHYKVDSQRKEYQVVSSTLESVFARAVEIHAQTATERGQHVGIRHVTTALLQNAFAPGMQDTSVLKNAGIVTRDVVNAFVEHLERSDPVIKEDRLNGWQLIVANLRDLHPLTVEAGAFGGGLNLEREACEDEIRLHATEYAQALGELFTRAGQGEFCFALFGAWGRGKTFLMKRVEEVLKPQQYETVLFSAWRYPNTPEVWVHLYETVAEAACRGNVLKTLPRLVRTGIAKHGPWPLLSALAALTVALSPKLWLIAKTLHIVGVLLTIVGVGGLIWIVELLMGFHHTMRRLSKDYLTATHHTEKLGLQATIGKDLKALLVGWMPKKSFTFGFPACVYMVIAAGFIWTPWHWFDFGFLDWLASPETRGAATILAALAAMGIPLWTFNKFNTPTRILLVIDDLDRCAPGQLLVVMESIKLLLEQPEISKRVQVAMLIEEDILKHAIIKKYGELKELNKIAGFTDDRLVRENCEKLFTAHLRLPRLSDDDMQEILDVVTGRERIKIESERLQKVKQEEAVAREKLRRLEQEMNQPGFEIMERQQPLTEGEAGMADPTGGPYEAVPLQPTAEAERKAKLQKEGQELAAAAAKAYAEGDALEEKLGVVKPKVEPEPVSGLSISKFVFAENEEAALRAALPQLRAAADGQALGPRSIRAFVFRY